MSDALKRFIAERRSIAEAATPGPWRQSMADIWSGPLGKKEKLVADCDTNAWFDDVKAAQNADFIADARNCMSKQLLCLELLGNALSEIAVYDSPCADGSRPKVWQRLGLKASDALKAVEALLKEKT